METKLTRPSGKFYLCETKLGWIGLALSPRGLRATTTLEVIQEFAHVRARRRGRKDAVRHARAYADVFAPLLLPVGEDLDRGLALFQRHGDNPSPFR